MIRIQRDYDIVDMTGAGQLGWGGHVSFFHAIGSYLLYRLHGYPNVALKMCFDNSLLPWYVLYYDKKVSK